MFMECLCGVCVICPWVVRDVSVGCSGLLMG